MNTTILIIGAGGVGSWLAHAIARTGARIAICDGDTLEQKNLDRQLFTEADIGKNKAAALADILFCNAIPEYFSPETCHQIVGFDLIMVAVDNNPARIAALAHADATGCPVIIGANETHSSEAYIYHPAWKGSDRDPRIRYPELLEDKSGDPLIRGAGCTGVAARENPQLISANFMAAAMMLHLLELHINYSQQIKPEDRAEFYKSVPYGHVSSVSTIHSVTK